MDEEKVFEKLLLFSTIKPPKILGLQEEHLSVTCLCVSCALQLSMIQFGPVGSMGKMKAFPLETKNEVLSLRVATPKTLQPVKPVGNEAKESKKWGTNGKSQHMPIYKNFFLIEMFCKRAAGELICCV